jgi:hypothetical protein
LVYSARLQLRQKHGATPAPLQVRPRMTPDKLQVPREPRSRHPVHKRHKVSPRQARKRKRGNWHKRT